MTKVRTCKPMASSLPGKGWPFKEWIVGFMREAWTGIAVKTITPEKPSREMQPVFLSWRLRDERAHEQRFISLAYACVAIDSWRRQHYDKC